MRGPALHTALVSPTDPRLAPPGPAPRMGSAEGSTSVGDRGSRRAPGAGESEGGFGARRQFASGGYQVHNGRPAAPVVIG